MLPFSRQLTGNALGVISGREASDDAGKRVEGVRIQGVRHGRNSLGLEVRDRFHDLVAEIDAADALVALLNARGLAVESQSQPDTADAGSCTARSLVSPDMPASAL